MAIDLPTTYFDPNMKVITSLGNKVSRKAAIQGSQNIVLKDGCSIIKDDVIIRGDLAHLRTGKYCIIGERTIIRPPYKNFSKGLTFFPITFGEHVMIESDCVIAAVAVGSYVHIGKNVTIGQSCVIKDCCEIRPNSVVPADTVIPPFSIVAGNPAKVIGELPEQTVQLMIHATKSFYDNYLPANPMTGRR
ncbi:dynactin 5 [Aphelenchoides avenae]|nr:dynactin 5 [Aphelenchus avenae]